MRPNRTAHAGTVTGVRSGAIGASGRAGLADIIGLLAALPATLEIPWCLRPCSQRRAFPSQDLALATTRAGMTVVAA
jgi:hypothetical protein